MSAIQTVDTPNGQVLVLPLSPEGEPLPGSTALAALDEGLAAGAKGVVVDTSPREVVTSAAIGFVIRVRQHLPPEVPIALFGNRQLDRLVEMMNLSVVLPTFPSIEEAQSKVLGG